MFPVTRANVRSIARKLRTREDFVEAFLAEVRRRVPKAKARLYVASEGPGLLVNLPGGFGMDLHRRKAGYVTVQSYGGGFPGSQYSLLIIAESMTSDTIVSHPYIEAAIVPLAQIEARFAKDNAEIYSYIAATQGRSRPRRFGWLRALFQQ